MSKFYKLNIEVIFFTYFLSKNMVLKKSNTTT